MMSRTVAGISAMLGMVVLMAPAPARAQPTELDDDVSRHRTWYGDQTLLVDGIATGQLALGAALGPFHPEEAIPPLASGVMGYALATPIVHWSHGHVGRGFASLGMRVTMPLMTALSLGLTGSALACTAGCSESGDSDDAATAGALLGLVVGGGAAIALDASVLAFDDLEPDDGMQQSAVHRPAVQLVPTGGYDPTSGRATLGLAGSF